MLTHSNQESARHEIPIRDEAIVMHGAKTQDYHPLQDNEHALMSFARGTKLQPVPG